MEKHITILGVLYIAFSVMGIVAAVILILFLIGGGLISGEQEAFAITVGIGSIATCFVILLSVPGIIGGIWLLKRKAWARILVLVLGVLKLFNIPLGTILGIYTLWVLLNDETVQLFESGTNT
jgi:hypothetical protein